MAATMYTATVLGRSWNILLNTWSIYRVHCRKPYASIGYEAMGTKTRKFVSVIIDITQFGVATVYLLLSAKNIHDMVKTFTDTEFSYCIVILIVAGCLLPVTYLKSPQDFWVAVMIAIFTTVAAIVLILLGIALDYGLCSSHKELPPLKPKGFFLSLGTLIFACGGHAALPTVQHDMKNPEDYNKSVVLAFAVLLFSYGPIAILGFLTYHDAIRDSILPSIQTIWIQQACNVFITLHCILTLTIVLNPLNQDLEDLFHCPHHFGWQRVLLRTATMLAVVFVGESIPNFGPMVDLVGMLINKGGSTMVLASLILPCLFYLHLLARQKKAEECGKDDSPPTLKEVFIYAPPRTLVICICIMVFGVIGSAAATFSAIVELSTTSFSLPCYVSLFIHEVCR
ncbi:transmembrane amino acid transporter protein [Cooperia oncophora]